MVDTRVDEAVQAKGAGGAALKPVIAVKDLSLTFNTGDGPVFALSKVDLTVNLSLIHI